jgi:hypothetical protein
MGIYVQTFAAKPFGRSAGKLAGQIVTSARNWAVSCGLEALFFAGEPRADGVSLSIYPSAGGIVFDIADGRVSFGVKTSIGGPGYHRALIDLCDQLQNDVGLKWRWDACGDQTGYALERDKHALQSKYSHQVEAMCRLVEKHKNLGQPLALNMPVELVRGAEAGVATPAGPFPVSFIERALSVPEEMSECASYLMPWWDGSINARFWADTLRVLLWTEVEWRAPRTPWERHAQKAAFACYGQLNAGQRLEFEAAMTELAILANRPEGQTKPAADGIGWKRRLRCFPITGPWRVNLPGYYVDTDAGDATVCIWFGGDEIRASSCVFETKGEEAIAWSDEFRDSPEQRTGKNINYRIANELLPLKNQNGRCMASAAFYATRRNEHQVLFLSVCADRKDVIGRMGEVAAGVWFDAADTTMPGPLME